MNSEGLTKHLKVAFNLSDDGIANVSITGILTHLKTLCP